MIHFLAKGISDISKNIEQEFFRIEEESHVAASMVNGVIAGTAVAIVAWLVISIEHFTYQEGDLLLFACLGSSAASIVFSPISRSNSFRSIFIAYGASCLICAVMIPVRSSGFMVIPIQCGLAVTLSIFLMRLLDAMHPAAVGSAMSFIIYERDIATITILMLAILGLLLIVKILAYTYRKELAFKYFPKEFKRAYYGSEFIVTVEKEVIEKEIYEKEIVVNKNRGDELNREEEASH